MDNKILFSEKVTSYGFYSNILEQFYNIYKKDNGIVPVLDFCETKYISPSAVPIILTFGDYLCRLYKRQIQVLYETGTEVHNFFINSNFYEISKKLDIFDWNGAMMDGLEYRPLRNLHKISYTNTRYSDADRIKEAVQKRDFIYDCLLDRSKVVYERILRDTNQLPDAIVWSTVNAIAEIETNAIMYSEAHSFTYVASNRYGTNISIADSGIGFEKSFKKANRSLKFIDTVPQIGSKFKNYLVIMSALNYSYEKHIEDKREDLWSLRTNIVNNNGIFKVQYENTQVIFSCNRCGGCTKLKGEKDISKCMHCLLNKYSADDYSPIKIFKIGFQGVRVEITVSREA